MPDPATAPLGAEAEAGLRELLDCGVRPWPNGEWWDHARRLLATLDAARAALRRYRAQHDSDCRIAIVDGCTCGLSALLAPAPAGPSLDAVLAEVIDWAFETFPTSTPLSAATHLLKEARELAAAPTSAEEIADCLMLAEHIKARVLELAAAAGVDPARAVAEKLAVCRTRRWKAPDADGVVEHERDEPEAPGPRPAREDVNV